MRSEEEEDVEEVSEAGKQSIIDKLTRLRRNCPVVPLITHLSIFLNNTLPSLPLWTVPQTNTGREGRDGCVDRKETRVPVEGKGRRWTRGMKEHESQWVDRGET